MGDCGVCIGGGYGDYDTPSLYERSIVQKSRKEARCYECRRVIPIGSSYERVRGSWDGELSTVRTCLDCMHIRDGFACEGSYGHGELWSDLADVFGEINTGCLAKIETASAKAYLMERWRKWKGITDSPSSQTPEPAPQQPGQ